MKGRGDRRMPKHQRVRWRSRFSLSADLATGRDQVSINIDEPVAIASDPDGNVCFWGWTGNDNPLA
jgi:hypothetical protein